MEDQVEEVTEEVVEETYNAFDDLTKRRSGVLCPNPHCQDRLFSYDKKTSVNCRCGLTYVSGGDKYLKFGVGYPFIMTDVRVISERYTPDYSMVNDIAEGVAEELGQVINDSMIPSDVYVDEVTSPTEDLSIEGDVINGPIPDDEV